MTEAGIFSAVTRHCADKTEKPFHHVVVDEAQDLGVPELRFLASNSPAMPNSIFFAGDLGHRIIQHPFSWKALGVIVQGRSTTLKFNYRTSHQIRSAADRLMSASVEDADGERDERKGAISIFNSPEPFVVASETVEAETKAVADFISASLADGLRPEEIGVFVRTRDVLGRARNALAAAAVEAFELTPQKEGPDGAVRIVIMHLAKGLEFKAVAMMGCDEDQLPLRSRIKAAADEVELEDFFATERQLFYVACTRA